MLFGFIVAVTLDIHSSCHAIRRGGHESFLPVKSCSSIAAVETGLATSYIYWYKTTKHKKLAKFSIIAGIVIHSAAAYHNYKIK